MKCLLLGVVMMEMADFELGVCSHAQRFVSDQDLETARTKVLKTFDGVENLHITFTSHKQHNSEAFE